MYKILLVEATGQATKELTGLLDWDACQCEVVGRASDGEQGLRLFRELQPDIVITGVEMPVMNGLDMIRRIREENALVAFIILANEREFEYARQAIELGVAAYLLQSELTALTLERALKRTKYLLESRDKLDFLSMGQDFKAYLNDGELPDAFPGLWDTPRILLLCSPVLPPASLRYMDSYAYWYDLCEHFKEYGRLVSVVLSTVSNLVLIPAGDLASRADIRKRGLTFVHAYQQYHKKYYHMDIHIALGGLYTDVKELRDLFFRARSLILDGVFNPHPAIMETQPQTVDEEKANLVHSHMREMQRLVADRHYEDAKKPAAAMMEILSQMRYPPLFQEVMMAAETLLGDYGRRSGLIYPFATIDQAKNALLAALDSLEAEQSARYSKRVRQMLRYIHEWYHTDASLNEVAGQMEVTAIYAGQLFKKETGQTFSEYLAEYRMAQAIELLESGKYKIFEVSEMVGYQSVPYFSKIFKRVTGKKPSEYI